MSTGFVSRSESSLSKQTLDSQNHKNESSNGRGRDACASLKYVKVRLLGYYNLPDNGEIGWRSPLSAQTRCFKSCWKSYTWLISELCHHC
eukprot:1191938-Prorocentrum_minimum.AAC.10